MPELEDMTRRLLAQSLSPLPSVADLQRLNRRRRRRRLAGATVTSGVVAGLLVAALVVPGRGGNPGAVPGTRLAAYISTAGQVSDQVLEQVGLPAGVDPPGRLSGQPLLTDGGKPAVVYVGAESCPYCAVARWALVVALSKFGIFSDLGQAVSSSSTESFPNLKSWSFFGSTYSSRYLTFDPGEVYFNGTAPSSDGYTPVKALPPLQQHVFSKYDAAPFYNYDPNYVRAGPAEVPFIDVGNRYLQVGASADASVLEGLSLDQIAGDLDDPSSPVARALDGSANYLIATLCSVAGPQTAPICSSATISRAEARLGASSPTTTAAGPATTAAGPATTAAGPATTAGGLRATGPAEAHAAPEGTCPCR
jgi:hypothetical protein